MDPNRRRRRIVDLTFREYIERLWKGHPAAGDADIMLALAARTQALVDLAGGADREGDLPISRWAAEAGTSARALARQTLGEWTVTGGPQLEGATPDDVAAYQEVCKVALQMIDL